MATAKEVRGVTAKRKKPLVIPVPDDPENQFISKAEFLKKRSAQKKANEAAEEARKRVLAEHGVAQDTPKQAEKPKAPSKVEKLRSALANAEKKLQEKPDSKAFAKKVKEISEELEVAESETE